MPPLPLPSPVFPTVCSLPTRPGRTLTSGFDGDAADLAAFVDPGLAGYVPIAAVRRAAGDLDPDVLALPGDDGVSATAEVDRGGDE